MRLIMTLVLIWSVQTHVQAGTFFCETIQSGNWSDPAIWTGCDGAFPDSTSDEALIKTGHTVNLDIGSLTLQNFTMETGSVMDVTGTGFPVSFNTTTNDFSAELGQINLNQDIVIIAQNGNDILLGLVDGAHDLLLGTSGTTWLLDDIGAVTPVNSIATDLVGFTRTQGSTVTIRIDGSVDTSIADIYLVGASSRATWEQLGTGDLVFGDEVRQTSGSPQQMTAELTGGSDLVFDGDVQLGNLTVNGSGNALVNANVETIDVGANPGVMTFNVPVIVGSDVTFSTTNTTSNIFFNDSLDDDGDNLTSSNVFIDTPNGVTFNAVGQNAALTNLTLLNATDVTLNNDVTTSGSQSYTGTVVQTADVVLTSTNAGVNLSGTGLNAAGFNTTINQAANPLTLNALDVQNVNTLTIGPLGSTRIDGDYTSAGNLNLQNTLTVDGTSTITVNDLQTVAMDFTTNQLTLDVTSTTSLVNGPITGTSGLLFKQGPGTLFTAFGSAINADPGVQSIWVQAGRLDTGAVHEDWITVSNDAVLGGFGNFNNTVSLNDSSTLDPGIDGFTATLITNGVLSLSPNSTQNFDLLGALPNDYDSLVVTAPLTLAGQLTLGGNYDPQIGDSFMIIENTSGVPISGEFAGLPEGASIQLGIDITYQGGDGDDVVLNKICDAIYTVDSTADSGVGSLREGFTNVCDGGVIQFDGSVTEVTLASNIDVSKTVTVNGGNTIINGGSATQIFEVEASGDLTLNAVRIISASSGFGAIRNDGQLSVTGSYFEDNFSSGSGGLGGGAIINFGTTDISNSSFYRNNADRGGALFNTDSAVMTVTNSTFFENGNTQSGEGGVLQNRGTITMTNTTMADSGDGDVGFGNTISQFGAGATINLINSVISSPSNQEECEVPGDTIVNITNTFIDDGTCGATLSGDAMLGTWGSVLLGGTGDASFVIPPLDGSPLINAGTNVGCPATDQLGVSRPLGFICDIGAIEYDDMVAPTLLAVGLNGSPLAQCDQSSTTQVDTIEISYSESMLLAINTSVYQLEHAGDDFSFGNGPILGGGGSGDNVFYPATSVSTDGSTTPTITVGFGADVPDGLVRLVINGAVTDSFGNPLNGGADLYWQFRIDEGNLLTNGHFDDCGQPSIITQGWTYGVVTPPAVEGGIPFQFQEDFNDQNASDSSGALFIQTDDSTASYEMRQCVNLAPSTLPLTFEATVILEPGIPGPVVSEGGGPGSSAVDATLVCELWDQADCMGIAINTSSETFTGLDNVFGLEFLRANLGVPDPAAASAFCQVQVSPTEDNDLNTIIDGVRVEQSDVIFEDGFETSFCVNNVDSVEGC